MIKYIEYNPQEATNCIIRSFSLVSGLECNIIEENLKKLAIDMGKENYTDIEVFEKYLEEMDFTKESFDNDICIKDLNLSDETYCIFCTDKKGFYHMVAIHDNMLYDKKESTLYLYPISIYKSNKLWKNHINKII